MSPIEILRHLVVGEFFGRIEAIQMVGLFFGGSKDVGKKVTRCYKTSCLSLFLSYSAVRHHLQKAFADGTLRTFISLSRSHNLRSVTWLVTCCSWNLISKCVPPWIMLPAPNSGFELGGPTPGQRDQSLFPFVTVRKKSETIRSACLEVLETEFFEIYMYETLVLSCYGDWALLFPPYRREQ